MSVKRTISIGVTGGIGSGKSYVCRIFENYGIPVFYTDKEAKLEMLENVNLQQTLQTIIGKPIILPDGSLHKKALSAYLAQGDTFAQKINEEVHPVVRQRMRNWLQQQTGDIAVVECALLFESNYNTDVDFTVAVIAPSEIKIKRVMERDGISADAVHRIMALQMDDKLKSAQADFIINNDGKQLLGPQIEDVLQKCQKSLR